MPADNIWRGHARQGRRPPNEAGREDGVLCVEEKEDEINHHKNAQKHLDINAIMPKI